MDYGDVEKSCNPFQNTVLCARLACENWTVTPLKQGFESLWDGIDYQMINDCYVKILSFSNHDSIYNKILL